MKYALIALLALALAGCIGTPTSPGRDCTTQEIEQQGKDMQAAQANAGTGVDVSGKQVMEDKVPAKPNTIVGRGEGDTSSEAYWDENRAQAGAPVTYQGVINFFPAAAEAENNKGAGPHPLILALQSEIEKKSRARDVAVATGNTELAKELDAKIETLFDKMAAASVATKNEVTYHVHMPDNYSTLGVASSAGANSKPGGAKTDKEGTSTTEGVPRALKADGTIPVPEAPDSPPSPAPSEPE
jgi:hypothetical protein